METGAFLRRTPSPTLRRVPSSSTTPNSSSTSCPTSRGAPGVYVHDVGQGTEDHPDLRGTGQHHVARRRHELRPFLRGHYQLELEYTEVRLIPTREPRASRPCSSPGAGIEYYAEPLNIAGEQHLLIQHDYNALNSELVLADMPREGESLEEYAQRWVPSSATANTCAWKASPSPQRTGRYRPRGHHHPHLPRTVSGCPSE